MKLGFFQRRRDQVTDYERRTRPQLAWPHGNPAAVFDPYLFFSQRSWGSETFDDLCRIGAVGGRVTGQSRPVHSRLKHGHSAPKVRGSFPMGRPQHYQPTSCPDKGGPGRLPQPTLRAVVKGRPLEPGQSTWRSTRGCLANAASLDSPYVPKHGDPGPCSTRCPTCLSCSRRSWNSSHCCFRKRSDFPSCRAVFSWASCLK